MCDELKRLLKQRELLYESNNQHWDIKKSNISGYGIFASNSYEAGELIFNDTPIVLGPRSSTLPPACVGCVKVDAPLIACSKGCRLPVCSSECENTLSHVKECELLNKFPVKEEELWSPLLYRALTPFRCLLVSDQDKKIIRSLSANKNGKHIEMFFLKKELQRNFSEEEESFLNLCCSVLNGTAFETELGVGKVKASLRGLYPLAGMMNHSCVPNTQHYFLIQNNIQTMFVVATCPIPEGTELTTNYSHLLWPTIIRRQFLAMTKEFWCMCVRCRDPTEFGTNLSALECTCGGLMLPLCGVDMRSDWKCGSCNIVVPTSKLPFANPSAILSNNGTLPMYKIKYLSISEKIDKIWSMGHKNTTYQGLVSSRLGTFCCLQDEKAIDVSCHCEALSSRRFIIFGETFIKDPRRDPNLKPFFKKEFELFSIRDDAKKILNIPIE